MELAQLLHRAGYDAETVPAEGLAGQPDEAVFAACQHEERVLVTLDRDFGDIRRYAPGSDVGIIILCPARKDRESALRLMERVLAFLKERTVAGGLWIVEAHRVRVRSAEAEDPTH